MVCNIKPVPFHESDKHIFAKIPGGVRTPGPPPLDLPMKPLFLSDCSKNLSKKLRERGKVLVMSNFYFSHSAFLTF